MRKIHQGNGFAIVEEDEKLQITWEVGAFGERVYYDISRENMERAFKSAKDSHDVMIYCETGNWPSEEKKEANLKEYLRANPELLIKIPKNQVHFDSEELQELLVIAEKNQEQ